MIFIALALTALVYGLFPLIFAAVRKKPITKKKYNLVCYGFNALIMCVFIALKETGAHYSGSPYLLWTWVFSIIGSKLLENKDKIDSPKVVKETKSRIRTKSLVMTAFFAAIVYLGIQMFRIPMPAAVGTPFLHFGHIFVMLAVICLGPVRSTVAGVLGLVIFDIVNGYIQAIPNVLFSTIVKCLVVGVIFIAFKKKFENEPKKVYTAAIICAAIYGCTNIALDFVWNTVELVIMGSGLQAALMAELASIPATMINAVFTVVGIAILYYPVTKAYKLISK